MNTLGEQINSLQQKKTLLVAPLNWGLGHATRCIPVIQAALDFNYDVIIASDGAALHLLQKEFPKLVTIELPSYNITYPKKGKIFKWKMLLKLPSIRKVMDAEKLVVEKLVVAGTIDGIISDNRFGVRNKNVPSVFITHQLNVLSGSTSYFSSKAHQKLIKKFDECWVPDVSDEINLSGKLGHVQRTKLRLKYMGVLSRMQKETLTKKYDILGLISGPEPQRSILEAKLIAVFKGTNKKVLLVRGVVEDEQRQSKLDNITLVNFMPSKLLERAINESEIVVSRSGYTTIMDLAMMEKKAFFIPTPGQYEQNYLAKRLKLLGIAPYCSQEEFSIKNLEQVASYRGLQKFKDKNSFKDLFVLFEGK